MDNPIDKNTRSLMLEHVRVGKAGSTFPEHAQVLANIVVGRSLATIETAVNKNYAREDHRLRDSARSCTEYI
jgi:hypothetical protein